MKTIGELKEELKSGATTSAALIKKCFSRIESENREINAFIGLNEKAGEQALVADEKLKSQSPQGKLMGIPIAVKDLFCHKGMPTTAASRILRNFVPSYSSTVTERLEAEGAIIIGKTNLDEFAMGSSNENSAIGAVKNPWQRECVAGGSSGGSAAAVAAAMAPAAIGTDTGGSIRQPAAFCGLVGIKPTYGRVSRYGIVSYASSLDQAGPMTQSVWDAAYLLEIMAGHDERDATSSQQPVPSWSEKIQPDLKGKKVGLVKEFGSHTLRSETQNSFQFVVEHLKKCGVEVVEVEIPAIQYSVPVYYLIATSEASSNLARYDGIRYGYRKELTTETGRDLDTLYKLSRGEGFGEEVKRRILLGTYALSSGYYDAYYLKACKVRRLMLNEFNRAFSRCDFILSPTTTSPAFRIGEKINDPIEMYLNDVFTTSANLVGAPAINIPVGRNREGLPLGVQFIAPHFKEQILFDVGGFVEGLGDWKAREF